MSNQELLLELMIPVLISRLELDKRSIDVSTLKTKFKDINDVLTKKLGIDKLNKFTTYFKNNDTVSRIIEICKTNLDEIFKDGKIDATDSPLFLRMVRGVYSNVNGFTKENLNITIEATDLVELCGFFLKSVIYCVFERVDEQKLAVALTDSAIELINFRMDGLKVKLGCLCFK